MRKFRVLVPLLLSAIILTACATTEDKASIVSFIPAEKAENPSVIENDNSEITEEPIEAVSEPAVEPAEIVPNPKPEMVEVEPKSEPQSEPELEPEPVVTAVDEQQPETDEPDVWLDVSNDSAEYILKHFQLPINIKPVYKTAVPIVVRSDDESEDWSVSFVYRRSGSSTFYRIPLERSGNDFIGRIKTGIFPGNTIEYELSIQLSGESGEILNIPGGEVRVLNNGPQLYSLYEAQMMFRFDPLFDIEKRGDSPGMIKTDHGWLTCGISVSDEIKRWSVNVFYRKKGTEDWMNSRTESVVWDNEQASHNNSQLYNIQLRDFSSGDEVEYFFQLTIYDTQQQFELYKNNPPLFMVILGN